MNTPFGSPCTRYLKKEVRKKWESEHPDHHTYVWGFDVNERSMAENTCKALSDYDHEFPLIEHGLTKQEAHLQFTKWAINSPYCRRWNIVRKIVRNLIV